MAILEGDTFNDLRSGLHQRKIKILLKEHLQVTSEGSFAQILADNVNRLVTVSFEEGEAYAAFANASTTNAATEADELLDPDAYEALAGITKFLESSLKVPPSTLIRSMHMTSLAYDIQKSAYLIRLGLAAGYAKRAEATETLEILQKLAKARYPSWIDYSLSSIVGMAMRNRRSSFVAGDWSQVLKSHFLVANWDRKLRAKLGTGRCLRSPQNIEGGSSLELEWADVAS